MLLQALSNFLVGKEGSIVHLAHEPVVGKNAFLFQLISQIVAINPGMHFFYCDTNANFFKRLIAQFGHQISHSKIKDSAGLSKVITPMQFAPIFKGQVVIIDCVSELFREDRGDSFGEYRLATASFAEEILNRINLISIKNNVHFILIHHTSFRPQLNCQLPVEQELMNIAQGLWVTLSKETIGEQEGKFLYRYNAHLAYQYHENCVEKDFPYELTPHFHLLTQTAKITNEGNADE